MPLASASSPRAFYASVLGSSGSYPSGWLRGNTLTVSRSYRDIEEDSSKLFTESYLLPAYGSEKLSLTKVNAGSFEMIKPVVQDISPSGMYTISLRHGGKSEDTPMILLSGGNDVSHYLDVSDIHGKFVGDTWFGGLTWSSDERYVAYVAHKKASATKTKDAGSLFEYRSSALEPDTNKFDFVDDWGEKYVGLVSLTLHVMNVLTGDVITVGNIDEDAWTVGQPMFAPSTVENKYQLAYTGWRNGQVKLGMIYCYQRDSAIFMVDLTHALTAAAKGQGLSAVASAKGHGLGDAASDVSLKHVLVSKGRTSLQTHRHSPPLSTLSLITPRTLSLTHPFHLHPSKGIKLARSPRFSPRGDVMVFIGSREGFLSHNGCSELFKCDPTTLTCLPDTSVPVPEAPVSVTIETLIPVVNRPTHGVDGFNGFTGVYTDRLTASCFLNDNTGDWRRTHEHTHHPNAPPNPSSDKPCIALPSPSNILTIPSQIQP